MISRKLRGRCRGPCGSHNFQRSRAWESGGQHSWSRAPVLSEPVPSHPVLVPNWHLPSSSGLAHEYGNGREPCVLAPSSNRCWASLAHRMPYVTASGDLPCDSQHRSPHPAPVHPPWLGPPVAVLLRSRIAVGAQAAAFFRRPLQRRHHLLQHRCHHLPSWKRASASDHGHCRQWRHSAWLPGQGGRASRPVGAKQSNFSFSYFTP
mmetsp:Transcript_130119/g.324399  ORF Transcript_130119/g.324399 Transcript_130119/m.324399 type:complete len:206 (+) Transcript_130119:758-1375(+)